jgi:hypothetical protein
MTLRRNLFLPACLATLLGALLGIAASGTTLLPTPWEKPSFTARLFWAFIPPDAKGPRPPTSEDIRSILERPDFLREASQSEGLKGSVFLDGAPDPLPRDWVTSRVRVETPLDRDGFFLILEGDDPEVLKEQLYAVSNAFGQWYPRAGLFTVGEGEGRRHTLLRVGDVVVFPGKNDEPVPWSRALPLGLSVWALSLAALLGGHFLLSRGRYSPRRTSPLPLSLVDPPPPSPGPEGPLDGLQDFPPPPPAPTLPDPGRGRE